MADSRMRATPSDEKAAMQKTLDHVAAVLDRLERINMAQDRPSQRVAELIADARHRITEGTQ